MSIHLSRGFATIPAAPPESHLELRSAAALTLGVVPFAVHSVSRLIFKGMASLGDVVDRLGYSMLRQIVGVFAVPTAAVMTGSAKLFAKTQLLVWGHYVRNPEGDGANARLAWYGADHLPWQDLEAISNAFFKPQNNTSHAWTLKQWSSIEI
jgi:hypothetical protein